MCYDVMTEEQRQIMEQSIINKGLLPLYNILTGPKRQNAHNKAMITCAALMFGALAVIDENNKDSVGKFLDRAYAYNEWYLDYQYETGSNEGYSYSRLCYEEPAISMDCMTRVTGREGLLEHPYFDEVLVPWLCDFLMPGSNNLPEYSDCHGSTAGELFKGVMLVLNKQKGNGKAGYYLQQTGLAGDPLKGLLYYNSDPVITQPTENDYVVFVDCVGYGGLRTGWEDGDMMFYIIGNNSQIGHNQYDQLSFQIVTSDGSDALMLAGDPGYQRMDGFGEREGHSTIIVDGWGQTVKGKGTLSAVVDSKLYGQLSGSAPDAYMALDEDGEYTIPKLTQYDRHSIMINHGDRPYYIIIDELASETERTFDFNLNTLGWTEVTVDGSVLGDSVLTGNKVAISGTNGKLFVEFVSASKLNIEAKSYPTVEDFFNGGTKGDYRGGDYPVLQADAGSSKSQQFLTILTKDYGGASTSPIYTQEVYDTTSVLGAKIYHNAYNSDIILQNRTTGSITAGGVTTNGQQTTIIGLWEDGYMEGYAVVDATSLSLNGITLMKAQNAATVSADFRGKASYTVTTETAQTVSLYASSQIIGVTVDGKSVEYTVSNGMASVALTEGTHAVELTVSEAVSYTHADDGTLEVIAYYKDGQFDYATDANGTVLDCGNHEYNRVVTAPTCTANGYTTYSCINCVHVYTAEEVPAIGHNWNNGVCSNCNQVCKHAYNNDADLTCNICDVSRRESVMDNGSFDEYMEGTDYRFYKQGQIVGGWYAGGAPLGENLGLFVTNQWSTDGDWSLRIEDNNGEAASSAVSINNIITLPVAAGTADRTVSFTLDYKVMGTVNMQIHVNGKTAVSKTLPQGTGTCTVSTVVASDVTEVQLKVTTNKADTGIVAFVDNLRCTVDGGENLLQDENYSFEEEITVIAPTTADRVYLKNDGWQLSQSEIIFEDATEQNGVLKITDTDSTKSASPYYKVSVLPNTTYTLTFDYMTGGTSKPSLYIRENSISSSEVTLLESKYFELQTTWTNVSYTFTTEETTSVICIFPYFTSAAADGIAYFDNFRLIEECSHSYEKVVTPPTCSEVGYTTYTCSGCGDSYVADEVAVTSHKYRATITPPTCTEEGYTTYTCSYGCGKTIVGNKVAALGHSYSAAVTAPTCTAAGYTTYTCATCGNSYTADNVAALGHTAAAAVKENEVAATCTTNGSYDSVVKCSVCTAEISRTTVTVDTLGHNYENGACTVCGAEDPNAGPKVDENLVFYGNAGLSFQDYIGVQLYFLNSTGAGYDDVYAIAVQQDPTEGDVTSTLIKAASGSTRQIFKHQVMAWSMAETFTITLYGVKDGVVYQGQVITTSVEELAIAKIADYASKSNANACAALVDMLNYGAAVQVCYNHNADAVPSAGEYASYATATDPTFAAENVIDGSGVRVYSNSISMQAKVEIQLLFKNTDLEGRTFKATVNGAAATVEYAPYNNGTTYTICKVSVKASQMRDIFTIGLYNADGTAASAIYNVSVEAYAKTKLNATNITAESIELINAMLKYGDSVKKLL